MERDDMCSEGENLIDQNDRKPNNNNNNPTSSPSPPIRRRSPLELEYSPHSIRQRIIILLNKKRHLYYLFAVSLPLFIILIYFSTDIKNLFSSAIIPPNPRNHNALDPLYNRMIESELKALYLLRQQRLSLLSLFNNNSSPPNSSSSLSNYQTTPELLKSALFHQISLNQQIQQILLSPHQSDYPNYNSNSNSSDELTEDFLSCNRRVLPSERRRRMEWKPRQGKYLFAICLSGQMSNHLICLQKHMFFAALMGRVLVIPSQHFDYQYSRVIDVDHINECLGGKEKFVVSFEEFVQLRKNHPHIDRFRCYFAKPTPCFVDEDHIKKLKGLGVSIGGKMETFWNEDTSNPGNKTVEEVREKFDRVEEDVVAIGDVFFANVEEDWVMQPGGPLAHKCKTLIEPSRLIKFTAQRFVQTFLGKDFVALHFRRHGWLKFCNAKKHSCFYSVPQAAECIARVIARTNSPVIYLSTDAAESETGLLQSLVVVNGKTVPFVKRPPSNSAEKWDALLYRHHIESDTQVEAMLDKTICAMSTVFIGSSGSTFTEDILRLRKDWGTASSCDEYLCQGELPNFIADDE